MPMSDNEYIKAAVIAADGWTLTSDGYYGGGEWITGAKVDRMPVIVKDALAAQLVRQVDLLPQFVTATNYASCCEVFDTATRLAVTRGGNGRTMNTIKAIVDSGVLND